MMTEDRIIIKPVKYINNHWWFELKNDPNQETWFENIWMNKNEMRQMRDAINEILDNEIKK